MIIFRLILFTSLATSLRAFVVKTIYLDNARECQTRLRIVRDGLNKGDTFEIKSESLPSEMTNQPPAECGPHVFNFGGRLVRVKVHKWQCNITRNNPYIAFYDSCETERNKKKLLAKYYIYNCTDANRPKPITSNGACLSIYHYKGSDKMKMLKSDYSFTLEVIAGEEIVSFPAGIIAGIIIGSMIVIMILVKVVCVLTGYEDKLPQVILANSPQKESLIQRSNDALRVSDENIGWRLTSLGFVESTDKHDLPFS
ncbi:DgyrCDS11359 [Dimorphilus gyrociliatus]|uniref:DgyrCDS11359 n=2 Tax=Dimorphilus gyrociliatus TaxID=2664684 RepID=A0A7I8W324_9ANNE|nr:DgyrCDS11359 [Dimorphilus gyrociliatus]